MARIALKPPITIPVLFAFAAACVVFLSFSRDLPQSSLWRGWRVLAWPEAISEESILNALAESGIEDFAASSNSRIENPSGTPLPESFIRNVNQSRQAWFSFEGTRYAYLRDRADLNAKIGKALSGAGSGWYLEGEGGFLPLLVIMAAIGWILSFAFSRNRFIVAASLISAILLPYSLNRWPALAASLLVSLLSFFASEYAPSNRLHEPNAAAMVRVFTAPYVIAVIAAFIPLLFFVTPLSIVRILASVFLFACTLALVSECKSIAGKKIDHLRAHPRFIPLRMANNRLNLRKDRIIWSFSLAFLLFFAGFAGQAVKIKGSSQTPGELSLPVPTRYTGASGFTPDAFDAYMENRDENGLSDLGDFIAFRWSVDTFPWRRLETPGVIPRKGDTASYMEYRIDKDGKITGMPKTMAVFDSAFIRRALSADTSPLERMLIDQGRFVSAKMTRLSR